MKIFDGLKLTLEIVEGVEGLGHKEFRIYLITLEKLTTERCKANQLNLELGVIETIESNV
jgi:VIT1/CCC1 family predicted Fe2+/Mn2+ transporter